MTLVEEFRRSGLEFRSGAGEVLELSEESVTELFRRLMSPELSRLLDSRRLSAPRHGIFEQREPLVDTRLTYLLTLLPPLPPLGETPPLTLAEALGLLRQQGGADLELLAGLLEAESLLREALDEWIVNPPGSRVVPSALPQPLRALFDDELVAGMTEEAWVGSVRQAYLDLLSEAGHRLGSSLLSRWSGWEGSLRLNLAQHRARLRGDRDEPAQGPPPDADPGLEAALAAWSAARSRGGGRRAAWGGDGGRGFARCGAAGLPGARVAPLLLRAWTNWWPTCCTCACSSGTSGWTGSGAAPC